MNSKDKRQKASDVYRESVFVYARKVPFNEAFPDIDDFTIKGEESEVGATKSNKKFIYTKQNPPGEYIDCSNPICYNGGFSIGSILREMVKNKQTELESSILCQGNEGSPKGKRIYRKCLHKFYFKVTIRFKNKSE